jgi:hypothetical protein
MEGPIMDKLARFGEYAAKFEEVYANDQWSDLHDFFSEDVVYEVIGGGPFAARHEGRDAVLAGLKDSLDSIDRRFDARIPGLVDGPKLRDDRVWLKFRVTYRRDGIPDLVLDGEEYADLDGGRIVRLEDRFDDKASNDVAAYLSKYETKLRPAK